MTAPGAPRLSLGHAVLGVLANVPPDGRAAPAAAARLAATYADVDGMRQWHTSLLEVPGARAAVVVLAPQPVELPSRGLVVWGSCIGAGGEATEVEVERALESPTAAGELLGTFVLLRVRPDSLRMVASSAFVHTLRLAGTAVATRAAAALALAGRRPRVDLDAAVEGIAWQGVLHRGEVLADVSALEETSVVDVTARGVSHHVGLPLAERFARGPAPTPAGFRDLLASQLDRVARVPGAELLLTAGKDSILLASCLAAAGGSLPTSTMGYRGYPDAVGAAAVARRLGWPHRIVPVGRRDGQALSTWRRHLPPVPGAADELVRHAAWGEGLQHPRDALVGRAAQSLGHVTALTGHSGELGRAYYWPGQLPADPVELMVTQRAGAGLPPAARPMFADVIATEVRVAHDLGRADNALDLTCGRRLRSWLSHAGRPGGEVRGTVAGYLSWPVSRALFDIPVTGRVDSSFFDAALALDTAGLVQAVACAPRAPRSRLRQRLGRGSAPDDLVLLHAVVAELDPGGWLARDLLGDQWWQWLLETIVVRPWMRDLMWNVVSVEALHRWCGAQTWIG